MASILLFFAQLMLGVVCRAEGLPEGYALLSTTRLPVVDLEGDGKTLIHRRYDSSDRLIELKFVNKNLKPILTETLHISYEPEKRVRITRRGQSVIRSDTEIYEETGELREREILWSTSNDGVLNRKITEEYRGDRKHVMRYAREMKSENWKLEDEETVSTVHLKKKPTKRELQQAQAKKAGTNIFNQYVECMRKREGFDRSACHELYSMPLAKKQLSEMLLPDYLDQACTKNDLLMLPNGFTVDLKSCKAPDDPDTEEIETQFVVEGIKAATYSVTGPMLSCLRQVNKPLAQRFAQTLQERRPTIVCAGDESRYPAKKHCKGAENVKECVAALKRRRTGAGGFYSGGKPNAIFLTGNDPTVETVYAHSDDDGGNSLLGSTLFHEALHGCSHAMSPPADALEDPNHDHNPPYEGDAVYGCMALCGGDPGRITRDGCMACTGAKVNEQTDPNAISRAQEQCASFPSAKIMQALISLNRISTDLQACESQLREGNGEAPACSALSEYSEVVAACGASKPRDKDCQRKVRIAMADFLIKLENAPATTGHDQTRELDVAYVQLARQRAGKMLFTIENGKIKSAPSSEQETREGRSHYLAIITSGYCASLEEAQDIDYSRFQILRRKFNAVPSTSAYEMTASEVEQKAQIASARRYCELFAEHHRFRATDE